MSRNARKVPSSKFVMNPSVRAVRVSGELNLLVGSLLKELPSDLVFALVGGEQFLEGGRSVDSK